MVEKSVTRIRRTLGVCAFAVLGLAGCSGDDNPPPNRAPASAPSTAVSVPPSFTGQGSAQFCALAKTYNDRFTSVGPNPTPAQLRNLMREGQATITEALNAAPEEIKADLQVLANSVTGLQAELERVNFDVSRVPPAALGQLSTPQFQAASTRFQAYTRTVCGVG